MKKHISKLLVCCLALGAILIPTASAAEGIYEDGRVKIFSHFSLQALA